MKEFAALIPRAVGTEKASLEDRKWDYDNRAMIPDYWQRLGAMAMNQVVTSGGSEGDIRQILYDHDLEMRGE